MFLLRQIGIVTVIILLIGASLGEIPRSRTSIAVMLEQTDET